MGRGGERKKKGFVAPTLGPGISDIGQAQWGGSSFEDEALTKAFSRNREMRMGEGAARVAGQNPGGLGSGVKSERAEERGPSKKPASHWGGSYKNLEENWQARKVPDLTRRERSSKTRGTSMRGLHRKLANNKGKKEVAEVDDYGVGVREKAS